MCRACRSCTRSRRAKPERRPFVLNIANDICRIGDSRVQYRHSTYLLTVPSDLRGARLDLCTPRRFPVYGSRPHGAAKEGIPSDERIEKQSETASITITEPLARRWRCRLITWPPDQSGQVVRFDRGSLRRVPGGYACACPAIHWFEWRPGYSRGNSTQGSGESPTERARAGRIGGQRRAGRPAGNADQAGESRQLPALPHDL